MESPIPSKMFEDLSDFSLIQTNLCRFFSFFVALTLCGSEIRRLMALFIVFSFDLVCRWGGFKKKKRKNIPKATTATKLR